MLDRDTYAQAARYWEQHAERAMNGQLPTGSPETFHSASGEYATRSALTASNLALAMAMLATIAPEGTVT